MIRRNLKAAMVLWLLVAGLVCSCNRPTAVAEAELPTAKVEKGDLQVKVIATGELKTMETRVLAAPPVAGGTLQIVELARTGAQVHAGDAVLRFDPSEQEYNLAQNRSDLAQAEQEIAKARADAAVQVSQDQLNLLKDKFAVRRAELDVSKNELVSEIDAKKNLLTLDEAKRALAQLQLDIKSHAAANQASITLSEEKKNKARIAMEQAQENIQKMTVRSPIGGLVVVHMNRDAAGGIFFDGMTLPDYQVGDQARPGASVGEVIDISQLEVSVQAKETDRTLLGADMAAEVQVNALPSEMFNATVKRVAGASAHEFWDDNPQRTFEVSLRLAHADPRLRPGYATRVTILGSQMKGVLSVPREAVFDGGGKSIVYLKKGASFERQEVKVRAYTEGRAVVEGVSPGNVVALVNPEKRGNPKKESTGSGPVLTAGR
ncbi:MAG: HlyD family efflux transporter periplasmic adaptor subunit [Candidatus Acidiferrum sp.]|jgi:multidrug resistance efflux pump